MPRFALVLNGSFQELRTYPSQPANIAHKGVQWFPCDPVAPPSFDPTTEKITGPTYTVDASSVTEVWTKVSLTAQEISDRKDLAVNGLNGNDYKPLLQILLTVVNDVRDVRAKLNAEAVASSHAAPYPAGQVTTINMTQLKAAIKAVL